MSQQGILSISPNAQSDVPVAPQNGNPFAVAPSTADQASPFKATAVEESPFQQVAVGAPTDQYAIPQPRPEGQSPVAGSSEAVVTNAPETQINSFEATPADINGGPFQMNGFHEQQGATMEAAPVSPVAQSAPFAPAENIQHDYEAAKAGLEPQQDFAAVKPRYQVEEAATQILSEEQVPHISASQPVPTAPLQATPVPTAPLQQAAPVPTAPLQTEAVAVVDAAPVATAPLAQENSGFQQLELRAIFGVNQPLSQSEIIQRARTLPGIRNVSLVSADDSTTLSNFRQALQGMGLGNSQDLKLSSGGGSVDFITEGGSTVAVLHEGGYSPGVEETLIIVTRELAKLA